MRRRYFRTPWRESCLGSRTSHWTAQPFPASCRIDRAPPPRSPGTAPDTSLPSERDRFVREKESNQPRVWFFLISPPILGFFFHSDRFIGKIHVNPHENSKFVFFLFQIYNITLTLLNFTNSRIYPVYYLVMLKLIFNL